ncbi:MAG: BON domain-containing protein [Myxococcales bacterium]|nr:BON domain-containing protein [Myxococcales bacterium]
MGRTGRSRATPGIAALVATFFACGAQAQDVRKYAFTAVVTIVGVDLESGTLVTRDGARQREIATDAGTRVQDASGTEIPLASLEAWDRVVVDARREMEGARTGDTLIADRVQLVIGSPGSYRADRGRHQRDAAVRERLIERLAASRSLQGSDVWVSVAGGAATLRGVVADDAAATRAIELARRTAGVHQVRSELRTDPTLAEWASFQVRDEVLAREVAERLIADAFPGARLQEDWAFGWELEGFGFELDVDADMGTVTLRGSVPSPEHAERAIAVTRRTQGVRSVRSELRVE